MPQQRGTRLGPCEIAGAVGRSGMGEVYRARDTRLGRDVAVKVLSPTLAGLVSDSGARQLTAAVMPGLKTRPTAV